MDTLVRDFDEALLSDLECPVCTEYMIPPITLCCNGHNVCNKCRLNIKCCPVCRGQLSGIRNVALEKIARRQMYPCTNRDKGCSQVFSMDLIADHQAECRYGPLKCPLNKFPSVKCSWKGPMSDLKTHVTESHEDYCKDTPYINSNNVHNHGTVRHNVGKEGTVRFINNEMFLCYRSIKGRQWFCVVQLVGTKAEAAKYKTKLTLSAANGVDKIVQTFGVRSFTEDFSDTIQSGKCIMLDGKVIPNFFEDGKFNLTVRICNVEE
jgi:E3 ubiquitin-protein ligase SIAH1